MERIVKGLSAVKFMLTSRCSSETSIASVVISPSIKYVASLIPGVAVTVQLVLFSSSPRSVGSGKAITFTSRKLSPGFGSSSSTLFPPVTFAVTEAK